MSEKKTVALPLDVEEPAEKESEGIYTAVTKLPRPRLGIVGQNSEVTCIFQNIDIGLASHFYFPTTMRDKHTRQPCTLLGYLNIHNRNQKYTGADDAKYVQY